ncbi:hypothetical protein JCM5350_001816 [Sporobolomyces pararoseus]
MSMLYTFAIKEHQQAVHVRKARTALNHCSQCDSAWSTIQGLKHHQEFSCPERKDPETGKRVKSRFEKRRWDGEKRCYIYEFGSNTERLIAAPMNNGSFNFEISNGNDDLSPEGIARRLAQLRQQLEKARSPPKHIKINLTHIRNLEIEIEQLEDATPPSSPSKSLSKFSPHLTARKQIVYKSSPFEI